jgi:branched-chain amino acid transport system ATP-binding protein
MLISIKDIKVHYGRVEAIKGISIEGDEQSIVALIGANGAGKTTTLRTISGLKTPTSGEIWFSGTRIDGLPPEEIVKRGIAHVPEGRRVFRYMTVLENLRSGAFLRQDREEVDSDFESVFKLFPRLAERGRQQAGTLSGGEQQMLAIARALMARPKLLLMDEPSLGLAPMVVAEVARMIRHINASGTAIILVEQNARMALRLAHKGYVLETGNIVLRGNAKELLRDERVQKIYLGG